MDQLQLARLNAHDGNSPLQTFTFLIEFSATLSRIERDHIREDLISKGFHVPDFTESDYGSDTVIDIGSQFETFSVRSDNIRYPDLNGRTYSNTTDGNWASTNRTETSKYFYDGSSTASDGTDVETITDMFGVNDADGMNFDLLLSRDFNSCHIDDDDEVQKSEFSF